MGLLIRTRHEGSYYNWQTSWIVAETSEHPILLECINFDVCTTNEVLSDLLAQYASRLMTLDLVSDPWF